MEHKEYLRTVAHKCFEMAGHCYHLEVAEELRRLGDELNARATEIAKHQPAFVERDRAALAARRPHMSNGNTIVQAHRNASEFSRRHPFIAQLTELANRAIATVTPQYHHKRDSSHRNH
jgi:hypothetical protein